MRNQILLITLGLFAWPAAAIAANGTLKVNSFPSGAEVWVDGNFTGKLTPMSVALPEGEHEVTVQISDSGWTPNTRSVTIVPGNNDLSVTLLPLSGGQPNLVLLDGTGAVIGPIVHFSYFLGPIRELMGQPIALMEVQDLAGATRRIFLRAMENIIHATSTISSLYYETQDCTGQAWDRQTGDTRVPPLSDAYIGKSSPSGPIEVWLPDLSVRQEVSLFSTRTEGGSCHLQTSHEQDALAMEFLSELEALAPAPFRMTVAE